MRSLIGVVLGVGALLGFGRAAQPDTAPEATRPAFIEHVTCGGQFAYDVVRDKRSREQTFAITLEPGAAARIDVPALWETFTVTAAHEGGGGERSFDNRSGESRGMIGNTSGSLQTYRVTVRRSTDARFSFTVSCAPVAAPAEASGTADERTCIAGATCTRSTPEGQASGTCSAAAADLAAPTATRTRLAFCD